MKSGFNIGTSKGFRTAVLLGFCCLSFALKGQDRHFWSQQFGSRASFLGGAVVGGIEDNSSIYYNPGAFSFVQEANLSVNTDVYKYSATVIKNGAGEGLDISSKRLSLFPQMVSGLITHNPEKRYRLGFTVLTRHHSNEDFNQRKSMLYDVVEFIPGDEYYLGNIEIQNQMSETWIGLCNSWQLGKRFGLGMSSFISYRNQRYRYDVSALSTSADTLLAAPIISFRYNDAVRMNTIRLFLKAGLYYKTKGWHVGMTVSLPSIHLWGESRVQRELAYQGLFPQPDATYNDQQLRVPTVFKHPFAIALGFFKEFRKASFGFSTEFFGEVLPYRAIKASIRDVVFPAALSTGPIDFLGFQHFSNAVLNAAIGGELQLAPNWVLHSSLRTDFSNLRSLPPEERTNQLERPLLIVPAVDLYHLSLGVSFRRTSSLISIGTTLTTGRTNQFRQLVDFTDPKYPEKLLGQTDNSAALQHQSISLLIGYTYFFALLK